ncbi:MAG: T9SS type A sorting domain-containing protein [Candidatus Cloacimonadota bacterium]|nr:T9SS type A sorting domain-containing protein [Candidatus Cloacimonadota bacterium]
MRKTKIIFFLILTFSLFADPPEWEIISGTQYSFVLISQISFEGNPFVNQEGNIFAAFGDNEQDCRGIGIWYDGNPGYWYMTVLGNLNNEIITFKIYNSADDTIYECNQTIAFENNATIGTPTSPFQFSTTQMGVTGSISLFDTNNTNGNLSEIIINIGGQNYQPNQNGEFEIPLNIGVYQAEISLENYASIYPEIVINSNGLAEYNFTLIDWIAISGNQYNMNGSFQIEIENEIISQNGVNQLAAFGADGSCRGVAVWEEANQPYWDGYWFMTIVGNTENEEINFEYFDHENTELITLNEIINFENNGSLGSPENPFSLTVVIEQILQLIEGWNWVSFFIDFENQQLSEIFSDIESEVFQIKSQNQSATYYNPPGTWIGDLDEIDISSTYLIEMNESSELILQGDPIDLSSTISLETGWNWIGYYLRNYQPIETIFAEITDNVEQLKSQQQSAIYYNPPGTWVGDLDEMSPGKGFKLKMLQPDILSYSNRNYFANNEDEQAVRDFPDWEVIGGTQYSFVLMADVYFDEQEFIYNGSNGFAAFGEDGTCRGIAIGVEPTEDWDGCWYMTVVGNLNDEEISFKIYDDESDSVFDCDETIAFADNETFGSPQDEIEFYAFTDENIEENMSPENLKIYPNPFNPKVNISFFVSQNQNATIEIFNQKGQLVKTVFSGELQNGVNNFFWNGIDENSNSVSSGIYFSKIITNEFNRINKIVLLK